MKKYLIIILMVPLLMCGCKKKVSDFPFEGKVVGMVQCTMMTTSISEYDIGYIVNLTVPDSVGGDYMADKNVLYHNCVILYHTRSRFYDGDSIKGRMYLDDKYSAAYCNYHFDLGIPEAVCYSLE